MKTCKDTITKLHYTSASASSDSQIFGTQLLLNAAYSLRLENSREGQPGVSKMGSMVADSHSRPQAQNLHDSRCSGQEPMGGSYHPLPQQNAKSNDSLEPSLLGRPHATKSVVSDSTSVCGIMYMHERSQTLRFSCSVLEYSRL
jgi:hypothetical protein